MDTYFASPERSSEFELTEEIDLVSQNPVMDGLLKSVGGLLAIVNEHRQIVAINTTFMEMLGIDDPNKSLGMRPGEVLECIHSKSMPAGCGTSESCSTCGAALAMITSQETDEPVEKICALTTNCEGQLVDRALHIRSHPIDLNGKQFLLLFMQDITAEQQRSALERTFFHDVNNMLNSLIGASEILSARSDNSELVSMIHQASVRLGKEVEIQRSLRKNDSISYKPVISEVSVSDILKDLNSFFINHPTSKKKFLEIQSSHAEAQIRTDISLLLRILTNMVTNAFEASQDEDVINVVTEIENSHITFFVENPQVIPTDVSRRIFQRNFSTKKGNGRGLGTYSMKLFGEKVLGGEVGFTSNEDEGTKFRITLPASG